MATDTVICNMALGHLGSTKEIGDLETERSAEAIVCRRFYETIRTQTLRDFPWPFATKIAELNLLDESPNEDEWAYAYRYPTDCLSIQRIVSGIRNEAAEQRVPYKIVRDDDGLVILTDQSEAVLQYTVDLDDESQYPPDYVMALSLHIAAVIAPKLTGGDQFRLGERARQLYEIALTKAAANSQNEQQQEVDPESEYIRARMG
jgi:hypothetical protein